MMQSDPDDPKGLVREAYRIEGIGPAECRSIFIDWALSLPAGTDTDAALAALLERHQQAQRGPVARVRLQRRSRGVGDEDRGEHERYPAPEPVQEAAGPEGGRRWFDVGLRSAVGCRDRKREKGDGTQKCAD